MKKCKTCSEVKPLSEFYRNGRQPNGNVKYHSSCRTCEVELKRLLQVEKRKIITEMFGDKCSRCSYDKSFAALDFHHIDPIQKEYGVAVLLSGFSTVDSFIAEISKCVLLCANCHRELHAGVWQL